MRFRLFILSVLIAVSASAQQQFVSDGQNLWGFPGGSIMSVGTAPVVGGGSNLVWYGAVNRLWSNGANWSNSVPPGANDTATFNNAGNGNVGIGIGSGASVSNIVFTGTNCAGYNIGSNTTEVLTWNNGGTVSISSNCANGPTFQCKIRVGSAGGDSSYTVSSTNRNKAIAFSVATGSTIEGNPAGVGTATVYAVASVGTVNNTFVNLNFAGVLRDATNGAVKVRFVKRGIGSANIGSSSGGINMTGGVYLDEGALSFVGNPGNMASGSSLFIGTNTALLCVNQTGGNYSNIKQYWNGNFSFNDVTYFNTLRQITFNGGSVDLGQYGTDTVRIIDQKDSANDFTLNCTVTNGSNGFTTGLKKIGAGSLVLGGTNKFTGSFIVTNGLVTLMVTNCMAVTNLQVISPGIVFIRTNDCWATSPPSYPVLHLDGSFGKLRLSNTVPQKVSAFYTNGVAQASGTWGATGSGCQNTNNNCFLGAGVISVP